MRNILATTGLILLAFIASGCASPDTLTGAEEAYAKMASSLAPYEPVDNPTIDGLARPVVTGAIQLRNDVDKERTKIQASEAKAMLGTVKPENFDEAFSKLTPEQRESLVKEAVAAEKADGARLDALLKQLADLGVACAKLATDIQAASKGNAGGAASTAMDLFGGPGAKAIEQGEAAGKFAKSAQEMISWYRTTNKRIQEANESNIRKAQS